MAQGRIQSTGFWEQPNEIAGLVQWWHAIAPFDDSDGAILDATFPPEHEIDLGACYEGKLGPIRWAVRSHVDVYQLTSVYGGSPVSEADWRDIVTSVVAYLTCEVDNLRQQTGYMLVGSDDDAILWFDGCEVWRHEGERGIHRDEEIVPIVLPCGKTRILAKVYNRRDMWGFTLRFTDQHGKDMGGLQFSPMHA